MNTPPPPESQQKQEMLIRVSTNPPKITGVGRSPNSMEYVAVRLDQLDEEELNLFKGKIDDIVNPKPYVPPAPTVTVWPRSINNRDNALEVVKKEQYEALKKKQDQKKDDIKKLDNKRKELLSAADKANEARIAIVNDSLVSDIPRGPLPIAVSKLKDLQAKNANEDEIKIVEDEIAKLTEEAEVYAEEETAARNAWKRTNAEIKEVKGSGKKTKRRRNKRRKTKRSKSKTFKKQKVTSNRIM